MSKKTKKKRSSKRKTTIRNKPDAARSPHESLNYQNKLLTKEEIISHFGKEKIAPVPSNLGIPPEYVMIVQNEEASPFYPCIAFFKEFGNYIDDERRYRAIEKLRKSANRYDYVELSNSEYLPLTEKVIEHRAELPPPFTHEPLIGFTLRLKKEDDQHSNMAELTFIPTSLKPIKMYGGEYIYPIIDFMIELNRTYTGCMFLSPFASKEVYAIGIYIFQYIPKNELQYFITLIQNYFLVQYSFYLCPERIVERTNTLEEEQTDSTNNHPKSTSQKTSLNTVKVRRTIYIGKPIKQKKEQVRHTECWYQRGTMVHYRSGKIGFRRGCYKGPKRNDPEARKRTKRYVSE